MSKVFVCARINCDTLDKITVVWDNQLLDRYEFYDKISETARLELLSFCVNFKNCNYRRLNKPEQSEIFSGIPDIADEVIIHSYHGYDNNILIYNYISIDKGFEFINPEKMRCATFAYSEYYKAKLYTYRDQVIKQHIKIDKEYKIMDNINCIKLSGDVSHNHYSILKDISTSDHINAVELNLDAENLRDIKLILDILYNSNVNSVIFSGFIVDDYGMLVDIISNFLQKEGLLIFVLDICMDNDNKVYESIKDNYTLRYVDMNNKDIKRICKRNRMLMNDSRFKKTKAIMN
jgi:hypothetical protein